jgi:hypothetical protein
LLNTAIQTFESCRERLTLQSGPGYFRSITPERKEGIDKFYEQTANSMYEGFSNRMKKYAESDNQQQKRIANLFFETQK